MKRFFLLLLVFAAFIYVWNFVLFPPPDFLEIQTGRYVITYDRNRGEMIPEKPFNLEETMKDVRVREIEWRDPTDTPHVYRSYHWTKERGFVKNGMLSKVLW